jgi:hypothetical protein
MIRTEPDLKRALVDVLALFRRWYAAGLEFDATRPAMAVPMRRFLELATEAEAAGLGELAGELAGWRRFITQTLDDGDAVARIGP